MADLRNDTGKCEFREGVYSILKALHFKASVADKDENCRL